MVRLDRRVETTDRGRDLGSRALAARRLQRRPRRSRRLRQRHLDGARSSSPTGGGVTAPLRSDPESETRFRTMADTAPVLLWMAGTDGLCHFFNQGWLDFTGRPLERELGNGWAEGVHAEDFQHCMAVYLEAFVRRERFAMEYRLRRADGQYRWIYDTGVPRYEPDGTFAGYIGSCIDVTEQREARDTLQREHDQVSQTIEA